MAVPSIPPAPLGGVPPLQKTKTWVFIVAGILVLCCACFGIVGLLIAFGPDVLQELGLTAVLPLLFA